MKFDILAVGLNPAYQRSILMRSLTVGGVNRADRVVSSAGGKGTHAARAANAVSPGCCALAYFRGGKTGRFLQRYLDELGIPQLDVETPGETRTCTTLITESESTEVIDPSEVISSAAVVGMGEAIVSVLPRLKGIALCGTYPPGVPSGFYADIASAKRDTYMLLDAYKGIGDVLATGKVDALKINAHELSELTGEAVLTDAAASFLVTCAIETLAITDGPAKAHLFTRTCSWQYEIPAVEVSNPIGAGDTCTGVMLQKIVEGLSEDDAYRWGLAAATASCLHIEGASFDCADMESLYEQIVVTGP